MHETQQGRRKENVTAFTALSAGILAARRRGNRAGADTIGQVGLLIPLGAMSQSGPLVSDLPEDLRSLSLGPPSFGFLCCYAVPAWVESRQDV
jgi:hypothetical protein